MEIFSWFGAGPGLTSAIVRRSRDAYLLKCKDPVTGIFSYARIP